MCMGDMYRTRTMYSYRKRYEMYTWNEKIHRKMDVCKAD